MKTRKQKSPSAGKKALARLPSHVRIGPINHKILKGKRAPWASHESSVLGGSDHENARIWINPNQPLTQMRLTILHEITHMIWAEYAFRFTCLHTDDDSAEEVIVSAVSSAMLDTLNRNPEIAKFILGGS